MSLCQKLQSFFEEAKTLASLRSVEFLSTALMISAKIFENEEEVKTFKKHAKFCTRSIDFLKSVELELLGKLNWNVDHSCVLDFGLHYFSNFLFHADDSIHVDRQLNFDFDWVDFHSHLGKQLGLGTAEVSLVRNMFGADFQAKKKLNPIVHVRHLRAKDFRLLAHKIFANLAVIVKSILGKVVLKSQVKILLIVYLLVFLKEVHVGRGFFIFQNVKDYFCATLTRFELISGDSRRFRRLAWMSRTRKIETHSKSNWKICRGF